GDGRRVSKDVNVFRGLFARPRIAIPHAAWGQGIVIAGNDVHGAGHRLAFEERESAVGDGLGNAVVVEDVTGDEDKVHLMFRSLGAELLNRLESGFANPVARTFLESCDSQTQMEVGGM